MCTVQCYCAQYTALVRRALYSAGAHNRTVLCLFRAPSRQAHSQSKSALSISGKFHLSDYTIDNLNYLKSESSDEIRQQQMQMDKTLFAQFKSALSILGIPFSDIMRILAAVLLLGNVRFVEGKAGSGELVAEGNRGKGRSIDRYRYRISIYIV